MKGNTLRISIPAHLADHKPCQQAYAFKIQAEPEVIIAARVLVDK